MEKTNKNTSKFTLFFSEALIQNFCPVRLIYIPVISALEMVGPKKRMFAGVTVQLFFTAGFLLTAGFAYYIKDWRHLQIALTLPGVLFFSYYW